MTDKVEETGVARYHKLNKAAKELGINTDGMKADQIEAAIAAESKVEGPTGITLDEAKSIEARLRFEDETRDKIRRERQIATDRAQIIAESESLCIPIELSENPTELELARARQKLGIEKKAIKPSPETLGIEAGKRGYYMFNNLEQEDASHTTNPGGKYTIRLIPDQIHVLSDFHIKLFAKNAVRPVYGRVSTGVVAGPDTVGKPMERCQRIDSKRRWSFEYVGEAPQDAPFGLVTDSKILKDLMATT